MSKIEVNTVEPQCGTNLTVGASGDTITFPSGTTVVNNGSQTGFGRTGTVDWDTTPKTATFSAVSGNGYFCNTSGGAFTVNLPAGSAGAIVSLADYAATWQTNNLTISPNGSEKIGSVNADVTLSTEGQSVTFVYVDSTQGWINTMDSTSNVRGNPFLIATGGTETTCGDYKIHTFTSPGTFAVTNSGLGTPCAPSNVDYLVVAGGAGGGTGGGGAGGFRESSGVASGCYSTSPLGVCVSALPVSVTSYPITVGGGGASKPNSPTAVPGNAGSNSIFSSITSAGGGGGGGYYGPSPNPNLTYGKPGGSGGGGGAWNSPSNTEPGGTGNTPPVSPPQGNNGGNGSYEVATHTAGGGGGGAGAVGAASPNGGSPGTGVGGAGGAGVTTSITGSAVARAGGGGGGANGPGPRPAGGTGGGGTGGNPASLNGGNGTDNTGGGGGGENTGGACSGAGGSGVVIIRYKFQ